MFEAVPEARCVLVGGPAEAGEPTAAQLGSIRRSAHRADRTQTGAGRGADPAPTFWFTRGLACRENYSVQSKIAVYLAAGRPIVATDFGDYQPLLGATGAGLLDRRRPSHWPGDHPGLDRLPRRPKDWPPPPAQSPGSTSPWIRNIDRYSMSTAAESRPVLDDCLSQCSSESAPHSSTTSVLIYS